MRFKIPGQYGLKSFFQKYRHLTGAEVTWEMGGISILLERLGNWSI